MTYVGPFNSSTAALFGLKSRARPLEAVAQPKTGIEQAQMQSHEKPAEKAQAAGGGSSERIIPWSNITVEDLSYDKLRAIAAETDICWTNYKKQEDAFAAEHGDRRRVVPSLVNSYETAKAQYCGRP